MCMVIYGDTYHRHRLDYKSGFWPCFNMSGLDTNACQLVWDEWVFFFLSVTKREFYSLKFGLKRQ